MFVVAFRRMLKSACLYVGMHVCDIVMMLSLLCSALDTLPSPRLDTRLSFLCSALETLPSPRLDTLLTIICSALAPPGPRVGTHGYLCCALPPTGTLPPGHCALPWTPPQATC